MVELYKSGIESHYPMAILHQKWYFLARYCLTYNIDKILELIILVHNQLWNNTVEFQKFNKSSCHN